MLYSDLASTKLDSIKIPKFKMEFGPADLVTYLKTLGINDLFGSKYPVLIVCDATIKL